MQRIAQLAVALKLAMRDDLDASEIAMQRGLAAGHLQLCCLGRRKLHAISGYECFTSGPARLACICCAWVSRIRHCTVLQGTKGNL
jgi:hypothetical protein